MQLPSASQTEIVIIYSHTQCEKKSIILLHSTLQMPVMANIIGQPEETTAHPGQILPGPSI